MKNTNLEKEVVEEEVEEMVLQDNDTSKLLSGVNSSDNLSKRKKNKKSKKSKKQDSSDTPSEEVKLINRDDLRQKLRYKIDNKRAIRQGISRSETKTLSDKIQTLVETLKEDKIDLNTPITEEIITKILTILSISDMKKILAQIDTNSSVNDNFKEFIQKIIKTKP